MSAPVNPNAPRDVPASADVVIVGAGIVGAATAYHLSRIAPRQRVVLVERDTTYAYGSTARSAGGIRQQFSTPENIALSQATLAMLARLREEFGAAPDLPFHQQGYLILATADGVPVLEHNAAVQHAAGAATELIAAADLPSRFPWLSIDGLAAGAFGPTGEGWIDPVLLMTLLRQAALAAGVVFVRGEVTGIDHSSNRIIAVRLADGTRLVCGALVNAAGPQAGAVAALAGIDLPVEPRKRYVYVLDCRRAGDDLRAAPLTVDPGGVWFRPEGRTFLCGVSPTEADEPPARDLDHVDHRPFDDIVWPALAARVPAFEEARQISAWAGYYDYNTLDQNAVIGPHPSVANFYFANGFSGHGLQQGYGAGRAIAELIGLGRFATIDLARFGYARIASRTPLLELNII